MAAQQAYNSPNVAAAVIDALLSRNQEVLVNLQDSQGRTPLMVAIEAMNKENLNKASLPLNKKVLLASYTAIIRALLNHGASILTVDNAGHDSLYYARNLPEILKMLQDELANREVQEKAHKEAIYGAPDMVRTEMPRSITDLISSHESSPK